MKPVLLLLVLATLSGCAWVDEVADGHGACDGYYHGAKHVRCANRSIRDAV